MNVLPWLTVPVFRVFIPFLTGITLVILYKISIPPFIFVFFLPGLLLLLLIVNLVSRKFPRYLRLPGLFLFLMFLGIGILRTQQFTAANQPDHFIHLSQKKEPLLIQLIYPSEEKDKTIKCDGRIKGQFNNNGFSALNGKVRFYLEKDSIAKSLKYGDIIICKNNFKPIDPPANPHQFDLRSFLANKQIYHQAFFINEEWRHTGINEGNWFFKKIFTIRHQFLGWLKNAIQNKDEFAVASALLTGYKAELDPELRNSYASTGAMHVLAVSGLHVGIIYLMISSLLSFLNPIKYGQFFKLFLIIFILWIYACITGLSPSVVRASTMFTFVAIGSNMKRLTNVYGSIMTSMFILLFANPYLITQVGFQLSYAAVLGIVFLQPKIYDLIQPKYWIMDKIWAITAVSLAAQLATLPISLFYFNQFPTYFLVSNLVVIPAATIILPTGFAFFLVKALNFDLLANFTGNILDYLLTGLNLFISKVESLPFSLINEIFISVPEFCLIYLFLIGFAFGIIYRNKKWLFTGMTSAFCLLMLVNIGKWQKNGSSKLAFLEVDRQTVLTFMTPGKVLMTGNENALQSKDQLKFFTYRYLWSQGYSEEDIEKNLLHEEKSQKVSTPPLEDFVLKFKDKKILLIDKNTEIPKSPACQLKVNTTVLLNPERVTPKTFLSSIETDMIILGSELPPWEITKWQKKLTQAGVKYHTMRDNGALVENL